MGAPQPVFVLLSRLGLFCFIPQSQETVGWLWKSQSVNLRLVPWRNW